MAKTNFQVSVPSVSSDQKFNLEVEVNSKGNLSITLPQQTVKATQCYLPFAEVVSDFPVRKVKNIFEIPRMGKGTATAETVTGRKLELQFSPTAMQQALTLALTADYC